MKKLLVAIVVALSVSACGNGTVDGESPNSADNPTRVTPYYFELPDGRVLECIWHGGSSNGISCNWDNPVRQ